MAENKVANLEGESRQRRLGGAMARVAQVIAISASLYHIYALGIAATSVLELRAIHLLVGLLLVPILYRASSKQAPGRVPVLDLCLAAAGVAATVYVLLQGEAWVWRGGVTPTAADLIFGVLVIALVLEMTRRVIGWPLIVVIGVLWVYAMVGSWMPGILVSKSFSLERIISHIYSMEGIYGIPIGASSTFVFLFVLLGAFFRASRAGDFFVDLAYGVAGRSRGGPAKVAIFASALFGTISGSGIANVVTTGTMTIPLMKRTGFKPHFAGAVEAAASTGGQIMPPIMGAAAFIMAEIINVPYSKIAVAAIIPALLYFLGVYLMIDFEAAKEGLRGLSRGELPQMGEVFRRWGHLSIPFIVLLYVLLVEQATAIRAAFITMMVTIPVSLLKAETRMNWARLVKALQEGATGCLEVIAGCASAGIIVALVGLTGIGITLSTAIVTVAQGDLFIGLLLTMMIVIILSMGLPTTAAYIIAATVIGPALETMGASPLQAHLFIFYFACMSAVTPPVALVAYPAAAIAGANPLTVGFTAWRLALTAFIVPYMFVYSPALLLQGRVSEILHNTGTAVAGVLALSASLEGWLGGKAGWLERGLYLAAAFTLIHPGLTTDLVGALAFALGFIVQWLRQKHRSAPVSENL